MNPGSHITLLEINESFKTRLNEFLKLNSFVRAIQLQEAEIQELDRFRAIIKGVKQQAAEHGDEKIANDLFQMQCFVNAMMSVLKLWKNIKSGDYLEAWCQLIDAEEYVLAARRTPSSSAYGLEEFIAIIKAIESALFPSWPFYYSPGVVENGSGDCSICGRKYSDCAEHLEDCVYFGKVCRRINREICLCT